MLRCGQCGAETPGDPATYAAVLRVPPASLYALIAATFPDLSGVHARRLELAARLLLDPELLDPVERDDLLLERFEVIAPMHEAAASESTFRGAATFTAFAMTFVLPVAAGIAVSQLAPGDDDVWAWSILGTFAAMFVFTVGVGVGLGQGGHYLRRRAFPRIAATLRPLAPRRPRWKGRWRMRLPSAMPSAHAGTCAGCWKRWTATGREPTPRPSTAGGATDNDPDPRLTLLSRNVKVPTGSQKWR